MKLRKVMALAGTAVIAAGMMAGCSSQAEETTAATTAAETTAEETTTAAETEAETETEAEAEAETEAAAEGQCGSFRKHFHVWFYFHGDFRQCSLRELYEPVSQRNGNG